MARQQRRCCCRAVLCWRRCHAGSGSQKPEARRRSDVGSRKRHAKCQAGESVENFEVNSEPVRSCDFARSRDPDAEGPACVVVQDRSPAAVSDPAGMASQKARSEPDERLLAEMRLVMEVAIVAGRIAHRHGGSDGDGDDGGKKSRLIRHNKDMLG